MKSSDIQRESLCFNILAIYEDCTWYTNVYSVNIKNRKLNILKRFLTKLESSIYIHVIKFKMSTKIYINFVWSTCTEYSKT